MAKLDKFNAAMARALSKVGAPSNMRKFGEDAADIVRLRTRLGSGVETEGGTKKRLKPLSESYRKRRKKADLHPDTAPNKSNLTFTGQMLDSLGVTSVRQNQVTFGPRGSRTGSSLSNKQVAEYVTLAGRAFNNLSKVEIKRITEAIAEVLNAQLKIELTK